MRLPCPVLVSLACAVAFSSRAVRAQSFACEGLPGPAVLALGASSPGALLSTVAESLARAPEPITLLRFGPGACFAPRHFTEGLAVEGSATYYDVAQSAHLTCALSPSSTLPVLGLLEFPAAECDLGPMPRGVGEWQGPIDAYGFAVSRASSQRVISAEAAYAVYGLGPAAAGVEPWTEQALVYSSSTSPQTSLNRILIAAVSLPRERDPATVPYNGAAGPITFLHVGQGSVQPERALAFTSTRSVEQSADRAVPLAFQARGQRTAYFPSSTDLTVDRINVREGRYPIWAPLHAIARSDAAGAPADPNVARVMAALGFGDSPIDRAALEADARTGYTPRCAMHVTRNGLLGPLEPYTPRDPCHCYYESYVTGLAACAACASDGDCGGARERCLFGYCEPPAALDACAAPDFVACSAAP